MKLKHFFSAFNFSAVTVACVPLLDWRILRLFKNERISCRRSPKFMAHNTFVGFWSQFLLCVDRHTICDSKFSNFSRCASHGKKRTSTHSPGANWRENRRRNYVILIKCRTRALPPCILLLLLWICLNLIISGIWSTSNDKHDTFYTQHCLKPTLCE